MANPFIVEKRHSPKNRPFGQHQFYPFLENAPYIAVAPIRTGNQSETGIVRELYLDWNNTPPRAPDDVMILAKPLPVIDPEIVERNADEPNVSLWF